VDQVWARTDITYIPAAEKAFVYLVAVVDSVLQHVLSWKLSNRPDHGNLPGGMEIALTEWRKPQMFHSDQEVFSSTSVDFSCKAQTERDQDQLVW